MCEFGKLVGRRSVEGKWKIIDRVLVVSVVVPDKCECDGGWMVVQNSEQELFHFHETKTKIGKCVLSLPLPCGVTKMGSLLARFSSPEKPCVVVLAPKKLWLLRRARVWMVGGPIFIVVR